MSKISVFLLTAFFIFGAFSADISAAALTVGSNADTADANPGDGACADILGNCTLRAAVQESNALSGADSITFSLSAPAVSLTLGEILITDNLTVSGDAVINANNTSRIFNIQRAGINVTLRALTITGGKSGAGQSGGCINVSQANLTVETSSVRNCFSESSGGGIAAGSGVFRLINSTLENNVAGGNGGGGGATFGGSGSEIIKSRIINNNAPRAGGGLEILGGAAVISNTTIAGNQANGGGGLVVTFGSAEVSNSTVSGNSAVRAGGGIALPYGNVVLMNSTVSGNSVSNGEGGGISTGTNGSVGYLTVRNSTIAYNSAAYAGGLTGGADGSAIVGNSIIAENSATTAPNIGAFFNSLGGNLVNNQADSIGYMTTDLPDGTNPLLGALGDNGGATQTHALLANSPAINAGINALAVDADGVPLATDQRGGGFPRIVGATVDIGAYEAANAAQIFVTISGRVTDGRRGIFGARVTLINPADGTARTVQTSPLGFYRIENVAAGQIYTIQARHKRMSFATQTMMIDESNSIINFSAGNF